jgi:hypothetical protein
MSMNSSRALKDARSSKTDGFLMSRQTAAKKARLVAKGFSQVEGLDYDQVFSPVVRFETVRLILAMAALENWTISGVDVRNAYLYGELDEEIYMEQPEGFRAMGLEHFVIRLKKALYGLKQAGLAWWRTLRDSMKDLGFEGLKSDAGLFIFRNKHGFVIAVIYVDDALFCGPNRALVQELKQKFMKKMGMSGFRGCNRIPTHECTQGKQQDPSRSMRLP